MAVAEDFVVAYVKSKNCLLVAIPTVGKLSAVLRCIGAVYNFYKAVLGYFFTL